MDKKGVALMLDNNITNSTEAPESPTPEAPEIPTPQPGKKKNPIKRVWDIISMIIVIAAVILAVMLVGTRIVGLRPLTVLSGSMEPAIKTGSLVYVKEVDTGTLQKGDVITYTIDADGTYATHRIIEIIPEGMTLDMNGEVVPIDTSNASAPNPVKIKLRFRTKGDNNDSSDATPVADVNVVGKVLFSVPYLGYVSNYIQHPPGMYIAISIGAILILLVFLPDLLFDDKEAEKDKKKKKKKDGESEEDEEKADEAVPETEETAEAPETEAEEKGDGGENTEPDGEAVEDTSGADKE